MKTAEYIATAHAEYTTALAAYEAIPFDLATALTHPAAPTESPEARAGAMVAEMGLTRALVRCVGMGLNGDFDLPGTGDWWRMVATYVTSAATEAQDG